MWIACEVLVSNSPKSRNIYSDVDRLSRYIISRCIDHSYVTKTSCCLKFLVVSCCFNILIPSTSQAQQFWKSLIQSFATLILIFQCLIHMVFIFRSLQILMDPMVKWLWNSLFAIQITGSSMVTFGIRSRCTEGPCRFPVLPDEATGAGFYPTAS